MHSRHAPTIRTKQVQGGRFLASPPTAAMVATCRALWGAQPAQSSRPRQRPPAPGRSSRLHLARSLPVPPPPPAEGEEETKFEQRCGALGRCAATSGRVCSIVEQIQGCLACRQRLKEQSAKGARGGGVAAPKPAARRAARQRWPKVRRRHCCDNRNLEAGSL